MNSGTTAFPIHVSLVPVQMVLEPTDVTAPQAEWVRIVKQTLTNAPASHVNMAEDVSINWMASAVTAHLPQDIQVFNMIE